MKQTRLRPAMRKKQIVEEAIKLAEQGDYKEVSARVIAQAVGITAPSVLHHFSTMTQLRRAVMREAARIGNVTVVAQGLRDGNEHAAKASEAVLAEAGQLVESWT